MLKSFLILIFVTAAVAQHSATFKCDRESTPRKIIITVTEVNTEVNQLVGDTGGGCQLAIADPLSIDVATAANELASPAPCGVTKDGDKFVIVLKTTACSSEVCYTDDDVEFTFECNFLEQTIQPLSVSLDADVTALTAGQTTVQQEIITFTAIRADNDQPVTGVVSLDTELRLSAELTISDLAKGVRVFSCTIKNGVSGLRSIDFVEANGCAADVPIFITTPTEPNPPGFTETSADAGKFRSQSAKFRPFYWQDSTGNLVFECSASFCPAGSLAECENSCVTTKRKRRSAPKEKEQKLYVLVSVSSRNGTITPQKTGASYECSNRMYVIGLVILGCVLAMAFVFILGMFFVLKRTKSNLESDKLGYTNKAAC